jgi:hypothetical protein
MSNRKKEQTPASNNNWPNSYPAPQAMAIINTFITFYPPEVAKETLWQLLSGSMSGPSADCWDAGERSNIILFHRLVGELAEVLPMLFPVQGNEDAG